MAKTSNVIDIKTGRAFEITGYPTEQVINFKERVAVNNDKLEIKRLKTNIKRASICVGGISIARLILKYSVAVDKFFFVNVKKYLLGASTFMLGIAIPRWFLFTCYGGFAVISYYDIYRKHIKKDLMVKEKKGGKGR